MARTQIPITTVPETGAAQPAATAGDAANDHYLDVAQGNLFIECKNTSGGDLTVTFVTSYTVGGLELADNDITVSAGATKVLKLNGRATVSRYEQSSDSGRIYVNVTSNSWEFRAYYI